MRPEARAVHAYAPAFAIAASFRRGGVEVALRNARVDVGARVEARIMLADDLVFTIAVQALGTGVPACHNAVRIEHDERAVGYAVDDQAKAVFAPRQLFLDLFAR